VGKRETCSTFAIPEVDIIAAALDEAADAVLLSPLINATLVPLAVTPLEVLVEFVADFAVPPELTLEVESPFAILTLV
jgi:hypothetical protein